MFTGSGGRESSQMMDIKKAEDQDKFYDGLLEYFKERGLPIMNALWETEHKFQRRRGCMASLCCQKRVDQSIQVSAQLTKPLYFTDETIQLNITIDNVNS